jgi:hypothetical protein
MNFLVKPLMPMAAASGQCVSLTCSLTCSPVAGTCNLQCNLKAAPEVPIKQGGEA